jgi:elongation factor Ts
MDIFLDLIKQLREMSGAGMGDCKKALDEAGGKLDLAMEVLRKKGIAKAAKRSDREAGEGVVKIAVNDRHNEGYMLQVNAETDFVVRSEKFQAFTQAAIDAAKVSRPENLAALLSLAMNGSTVGETLANLSGIVGEKMEIIRYDMVTSAGTVASYSHDFGRIGVLVALDKSGIEDLAREIAMQVAAANPKYIDIAEVPAVETDKEKEIYAEQLAKEGKPQAMVEKIITGKLAKYFEEVCLVKQEYIKDDKKKVSDILSGSKVEKFIRFAV